MIGPSADGFIDVGGDVREIMMHAAVRAHGRRNVRVRCQIVGMKDISGR